MKTVGEFKDAGLVFVNGDGFINGESTKLVLTDANSVCIASHAIVHSFAWRENTGVKPEFMGLIEVELKDGTVMHPKKSSELMWALKLSGFSEPRSITKWRPSLNQPKKWPDNSRMDIIGQNGNDGLHYDKTAKQVEVIVNNNTPFSIELAEKGGFSYEFKAKELDDKPIFTQVMADAGELPPVGSKLTLFKKTHSKRIDEFLNEELTIIGITKCLDVKDVITWDHEHLGLCCGVYLTEYFKPIDTRTDREKAIDGCLKLMVKPCNLDSMRMTLGAAYDAGLIKW